jgi:ribonuclease HIII
MQNENQKIALITAENLRQKFQILNYSVSDLQLKIYNYEFQIISNNNIAKILIYFGRKGIKTVVQGINNKLNKECLYFINGTIPSEDSQVKEPDRYIGSDESGKGDFFGPLIVCAFAYDNSIKEDLIKLKIKDSKQISDSKVIEIYNHLKQNYSERFNVVEIHPKKYNLLYNKINNLNSILIWAHSKAINNLLDKFDYNNVIIDKFTKIESIKEKLKFNKNLIIEQKAERFIGVAAASIIARAKFLNWFEKKERELGRKIPLGASASVTKFANEIQNEQNTIILDDLVKFHFKNFKLLDK